MSGYVWPDPQGILAYLSDLMARDGAVLKVRAPEDVTAGFARARTALDYTPDATAFASQPSCSTASRRGILWSTATSGWHGWARWSSST